MYLFDTDTISQVMRREPPPRLMARYTATPTDQQFTSSISIGELFYGAFRSNREETIVHQVESLILQNFTVLPFDAEEARAYARIRVDLELRGMRLDDPDLRIVAVALVNDLTLVTGNVRHFARIPDLRIENWIAEYG